MIYRRVRHGVTYATGCRDLEQWLVMDDDRESDLPADAKLVADGVGSDGVRRRIFQRLADGPSSGSCERCGGRR